MARNNGAFIIDASEDVSEDVARAVSRSFGIVTGLEAYRPSLNEIFLEVTRPVSGDAE